MPQRLLGIDYGQARIGIAVCDALGISTRPIGFIPRDSDAAAAALVARIAAQERVEGIVIGLPVHAVSGEAGGNVTWVRAFISVLAQHCPLPVYEEDERYSSAEAEAALRQEGRWPAEPGQIDAKAAAIILRRYLDR
ncbi:MAG: Holliday junction resolvase RuvX [Planctomycetota bacterium]